MSESSDKCWKVKKKQVGNQKFIVMSWETKSGSISTSFLECNMNELLLMGTMGEGGNAAKNNKVNTNLVDWGKNSNGWINF